MKIQLSLLPLVFLFLCGAATADTSYQPFVLASISDNALEEQTQATVSALEQAGFSVVGQYSPLEDANVIVVTNPQLKAAAALTDRGGYGAGQRVSVALRNGKTEVAFINPLYLQYAYRMGSDLQNVHDQLSLVLGHMEEFGAKKKMTAKKLGKYHYMVAMQRFDDPSELGSFDSHATAVAAVEAGLAAEGDSLTQIYRIDIPGTQQTVFGVGMKATNETDEEMDIDATHQMSIVDFEGHSKAAYFPYEVLVNGKQVEALHMRFRMAVHFPDLNMMGAHGFTKLMSSPGATEDALIALPSLALAGEPFWIDVRSAGEYSEGHVAQAVNIPHEEIAAGIGALTTDKDAPIYVYCRSGRRSGIAKETLENLGYTQVLNLGGLDDALEKSGQEIAH